MILSRTQLKDFTTDKVTDGCHLIMDVSDLGYGEEQDTMQNALNLVKYIKTMNRLNNIFDSLGVNKKIEVSIYYDAIKLIMENKSFSDKQIEIFMQTQIICYDLERTLYGIAEIDIDLPCVSELSLFGFTNDGVIVNKEDYFGLFVDKYMDLKHDVIHEKRNVSYFISKTRELYNNLPREKDLKISA